ncbi:MAG: ATP-grasp domain-containing protein [Phyllobacterium sp.]
MPNKAAILIAAISGRSLAAAARRAGFRPLVADLFNDADTLALADRAVKLPGSIENGIDPEHIVDTLSELAGNDAPAAMVYGSGFERRPDLIEAISRRFTIAGNTAATVRLVKDPVRLSHLCSQLAIPHPDIRLDPPHQTRHWLIKLCGGAGGSHVKPADAGRSHVGRYFQRFIAGRNLSALFLADGKAAHLVGFSRQWPSPSRESPFRYGGAVRLRRYDRAKTAEIKSWLSALTLRTGLVGLCSADFIDGESGLHLIEINPRPGATLDIFDCETTPLLREHLRACSGSAISVPVYEGSAAAAIAYTPNAIAAFPGIDWPSMTADHQISGTALAAGDPVCTVFATASSAMAAERAVKSRIEEIAANWKGDFS